VLATQEAGNVTGRITSEPRDHLHFPAN